MNESFDIPSTHQGNSPAEVPVRYRRRRDTRGFVAPAGMLWQSGKVAAAEKGTVSMAMGDTQVISQIFLRLQDPKLHINRYIYASTGGGWL